MAVGVGCARGWGWGAGEMQHLLDSSEELSIPTPASLIASLLYTHTPFGS